MADQPTAYAQLQQPADDQVIMEARPAAAVGPTHPPPAARKNVAVGTLCIVVMLVANQIQNELLQYQVPAGLGAWSLLLLLGGEAAADATPACIPAAINMAINWCSNRCAHSGLISDGGVCCCVCAGTCDQLQSAGLFYLVQP